MDGVDGSSCSELIFIPLLSITNFSFVYYNVILSCPFEAHYRMYHVHFLVSKDPPKMNSLLQAVTNASIAPIDSVR